jgi:hypothetical protein
MDEQSCASLQAGLVMQMLDVQKSSLCSACCAGADLGRMAIGVGTNACGCFCWAAMKQGATNVEPTAQKLKARWLAKCMVMLCCWHQRAVQQQQLLTLDGKAAQLSG